MPLPSSTALRAALVATLAALGLAGLVALAGGPDRLGAARPLAFGVLLFAWFGLELRHRSEAPGRLLWIGLAAATLLIAASVGDLVT